MKLLSVYIFTAGLLFSQCKSKLTTQASNANQETAAVLSFGEKIDDQGSIAFDHALEKLQGDDSLKMKISAKVTEVCQAKGCWMNVVAENGKEKSMFVKFKDYGFFMPKDCAGKTVVMEGMAYKEVTPVDELRHYASDKGASKEEIEKIIEPKEELKFMASGVLLYNKNN